MGSSDVHSDAPRSRRRLGEILQGVLLALSGARGGLNIDALTDAVES